MRSASHDVPQPAKRPASLEAYENSQAVFSTPRAEPEAYELSPLAPGPPPPMGPEYMVMSAQMMKQGMMETLKEYGAVKRDDVVSIVREEVYVTGQRCDKLEESTKELTQANTDLTTKVDGISTQLQSIEQQYSDLKNQLEQAKLTASAPVSPRTMSEIKQTLTQDIKKTLTRTSSMPSFKHNPYEFDPLQIDEAKVRLKLTFDGKQMDRSTAEAEVAKLCQQVGYTGPVTVVGVTMYRKSNSTDATVDLEDLDNRNTLRDMLSKYDSDHSKWTPVVEGVQARIVHPAFEEYRFQHVKQFKRLAANHFQCQPYEIKYDRVARKLHYNGTHIGTQSEETWQVKKVAEAFA